MRPTLVFMFAVLTGCPGSDPTDPTDDTNPPTPTDDTADTTPRTDVSGTVTDSAGAPIAEAQIRFCRGQLCLNASSDATGAFGFDRVAAEPTSLEVLAPDGTNYATAFAAVTLEVETPRTFAITLLPLDAPTTLGDTAWITAGTGLRVEVAAADLEPPAFVDPATEIAGVAVPAASHPPLDGLTDVLGVWYLSPFDHHAPNGLPLELDNTFSVPEGQTVRVWVGDYASSTWLDAGTLTASGALLTGSAELPLLSTVVVSGPYPAPM